MNFEQFRRALAERRSDFRIIVPTATMVQHRRNQLAREGFVFRPDLIVTLARFVKDLTPDLQQISKAQLYLMVEEAVRRTRRTEFSGVADLPGFQASLARTLEQLDAAGCDAAKLRENLPPAPLVAAFLAIWEVVEDQMSLRGLVMRSKLLAAAASRVEQAGLPGIKTVWLDGFASLSQPEMGLIEAIGNRAEAVLTDDEKRSSVPRVVFVAEDAEREVDEIARRILAENQSGRLFREMGVILRARAVYVPLLKLAFERFGIPARFYFGASLNEHPVAQFFISLVDALLSGWDHERTMRALRLAPVEGTSPAMDILDVRVREQIPNQGFNALAALMGESKLLKSLENIESWRDSQLTVQQWAARLQGLRSLFWPGQIPDSAGWDTALIYRSQAAALDAFDAAIEEAAEYSGNSGNKLSLPDFWRVAKAVLRLTSLRVQDQRRDVVHVLSAYEARQWDLETVFVCGLVEKQFPKRHQQNGFFPDAAVRHLQKNGVPLRTAAELDDEETLLFETAAGCATKRLFLSYPRCDARGDQNIPSIFLARITEDAEESGPVQPARLAPPASARAAVVQSADLLRVLDEKHQTFSISNLESYLQCPFQFFANRTLRLREFPARSEERLELGTQGTIVHEVLAKWYLDRPPIEPLFDAIFRQNCEKRRVPQGYRTEMLRQQMLAVLQVFAADESWPRATDTLIEQEFIFTLDDSIAIKGRIDRLERLPDGSGIVIDYKYSRATPTKAKTEDDTKLQGPLYAAALERHFGLKPGAMVYYTLREAGIFGWGTVEHLAKTLQPLTPEWMAAALAETRRAVSEIRGGRIAAKPANVDPCRYCDYRDLCRYEVAAVMTAAGD